jgi:hypothetical protein
VSEQRVEVTVHLFSCRGCGLQMAGPNSAGELVCLYCKTNRDALEAIAKAVGK